MANGLESLSQAEKDVLRAFHVTPEIKLVADALGRKPETIKAHLRSARAKLGVSQSSAAARKLVLSEEDFTTSSEGTPMKGMSLPAEFSPFPTSSDAVPLIVREAGLSSLSPTRFPRWLPPLLGLPGERNDLGLWDRAKAIVVMVTIIALATGVMISGFAAVSTLLLGLGQR